MAEEFQSPQNHKNVVHRDIIIIPRFRSVVVMAGWDEEALLEASLVGKDTPERESSECQKRTNLASKSPQTNSRRIQRYSPFTNPALVLNLDDDDIEARVPNCHGPVAGKGNKKCRTEPKFDEVPHANLPCMDKLREELSCAVTDKCGKKCPKCRQLIGYLFSIKVFRYALICRNGRSCILNTSLWNTIQLLFPQEVEARKVVEAKNSREEVKEYCKKGLYFKKSKCNVIVSFDSRNQSGMSNFMGMNKEDSKSNEVIVPSQAEDAALALRLQREEFMVAFRAADEPQPQVREEASTARANLRAMASRAIDIRLRRRLT
ncbi:hypothetical protein MKW92_014147 [Papaver armeniacum]|nr:hypothetical protein MKW92_014147 [Papaver armeniacum]